MVGRGVANRSLVLCSVGLSWRSASPLMNGHPHPQYLPVHKWYRLFTQKRSHSNHEGFPAVQNSEAAVSYPLKFLHSTLPKWFLYQRRIQLLVYPRVPILRFSIKATAAPLRSDWQEGFRCIGSHWKPGCHRVPSAVVQSVRSWSHSADRIGNQILLFAGSMLAQLCSSEFLL